MGHDLRDHWPRHARQWALVGAPLRPVADDVRVVERAVAGWADATGRAPRALLLGVTPELATMAWPAGTTLTAVDRSEAMIGAVFPADAGTAIVGHWEALPPEVGVADVVVGDGCLCCLPYPDGYRALAAELRRVVPDDGVVVLRLFAAPEAPEALGDVAADLRAGRIGSFHALKWRIAMAIQPASRNVRVADILAAFDEIAPDRDRLPWPRETVETIEAYRGSVIEYAFPTTAEAVAALGEDLEATSTHVPTYELGDRCPTLVFRPRPR